MAAILSRPHRVKLKKVTCCPLQELALLHHSRRTATVVSQDPVQLLAVGRDDFFDIFMSGQGPDGIPEHIKFAR